MHYRFARPAPLHTLTESAQAARDAVRAYGRENPLIIEIPDKGPKAGRSVLKRVPREQVRNGGTMVSKHVPPWEQADLGTLTGSALKFAEAAQVAGFEVAAKRAGPTICVGVRLPLGILRAYWKSGNTKGALYAGRAINVTEATAALYEVS